MVLYKCDKCFKEFNHKYNYLSHKNRKNPCIQSNLEDNNIDKDFIITELKNENIELKEEIEILKEEINKLKLEKELEAKEIYKNVLEKYICAVGIVKSDSSVSKASNKKSKKKLQTIQ